MDTAVPKPDAMPARSSMLRYPLRSASKGKEGKPAAEADASRTPSSLSRRRPSIVSKSVSILDLSGNDKSSAKLPRRLSTPFKPSSSSTHLTKLGNITPICENRAKKPGTLKISGSPASDASKSANRKKYSRLSDVSYWLTQIKLSESASKHSISLGFFKLAMESGCEPLERMRRELKSYAVCHNILELGEPAREVLSSYEILGDVEDAQNSQESSPSREGGMKSLNDASSCPSIPRAGYLKPKSVNTDAFRAVDIIAKNGTQRKFITCSNRATYSRKPATPRPLRDGDRNAQKKMEKVDDPKKEKNQAKSMPKKLATETVVTPSPEDSEHEDKENADHQHAEEGDSTMEI